MLNTHIMCHYASQKICGDCFNVNGTLVPHHHSKTVIIHSLLCCSKLFSVEHRWRHFKSSCSSFSFNTPKGRYKLSQLKSHGHMRTNDIFMMVLNSNLSATVRKKFAKGGYNILSLGQNHWRGNFAHYSPLKWACYTYF